ncbi:hypothetical protein [Pseudonocardia alni]|nr:hypothetical protein [Pseudonocardia alni]
MKIATPAHRDVTFCSDGAAVPDILTKAPAPPDYLPDPFRP